jgi:hypothetical protein
MWQLRDGGCDAKPGSSDFPIAFTLRYRYYIFPTEMDSSSFSRPWYQVLIDTDIESSLKQILPSCQNQF